MANKNAPQGDQMIKPGRRKNVKKSPQKENNADVADKECYCPCDVYISEEISISCNNCTKYWHLCCVGLSGLTEENVEKLNNWNCPDCFFSPHSKRFTKTTSTVPGECGTMKVVIKEELHLIQPVIAATVENAVRKCMANSTCTKNDVESVVKSYAEATKQSQKQVIEETTKAHTAQSVVEKVVRKLDADKVEREKRKENVVVMNVPESKMESSAQKAAIDLKFCMEKLGMSRSDIDKCWRAGKVDSEKPNYCRPLVIKMSDVDNVDEWTRNGRGHKTESGFWINKDLCDADRKANFLARKERRERMSSAAAAQ